MKLLSYVLLFLPWHLCLLHLYPDLLDLLGLLVLMDRQDVMDFLDLQDVMACLDLLGAMEPLGLLGVMELPAPLVP
jgi:hypothetical protein